MRFHYLVTTMLLMLALAVSGCGNNVNVTSPPLEPLPEPTAVPAVDSEPDAEMVVDYEKDLPHFDPNNFDDPTNIDNPWLPLRPGTQLVFEGFTEEAGVTEEHQVIFTVTDLKKVIHGVLSVVVWDQDFSEGVLVETELAFFAQDNEGNVWRMGEYPEVYENGVLVETPAWISGLKGAQAGIMMQAEPKLDTPSYSQGWGPAVDFTDRALVDQVGQEVCVPVDCYDNVLIIAEFSRSEPDAFQIKYYAEGVGNVFVDWRGADATRETLELVAINQLTEDELAQARASALELEQRAYQTSLEVYGQTEPAK